MDGVHPATSQMNNSGASDVLKGRGRAAVQGGFNRLEKWPNKKPHNIQQTHMKSPAAGVE